MRMLALLILSVFCLNAATIPANVLINWEGVSRGIVAPPSAGRLDSLNAGTFGDYQYWQLFNATNTDPHRAFIVSNLFTSQFGVTVSNVNYTFGSGTNCLQMLSGTNHGNENLKLVMGEGGTNTRCMVIAQVIIAVTNAFQSLTNLDILEVDNTWRVIPQLFTYDSGISAAAHSNTNGGSTVGDGFTVTPAKEYLLIAHIDDVLSGSWTTVRMRFLDPANNYAVDGSSDTPSGGGDCSVLRYIIGYIGNIPGSIYWGDTLLQYGTTQAGFEATIASLQSPSLHTISRGNVRLNGKVLMR